MSTWVAFLRGVNVGGNKKVPMADLRELMLSMGFARVATLIQSGNVVFETEDASADALESEIERQLELRFGFSVAVMVRSKERLAAVIAQNPLRQEADAEPNRMLVMFLRAAPAAGQARAMESHPGPERAKVIDDHVYLYYPAGVGASKFHVPMLGTARNWNTVLKLQEMATNEYERP